jgi:hypothetical protein
VDGRQWDFIVSLHLTPKCQIEESAFVQHSNHQAPKLLRYTNRVPGFQKELPHGSFYEDPFLAFVEDNQL